MHQFRAEKDCQHIILSFSTMLSFCSPFSNLLLDCAFISQHCSEWQVSLWAMPESLASVCYCCPTWGNLWSEVVRPLAHSSTGNGIVSLEASVNKLIGWAAILQLLMLTHPVHYQQERNAGHREPRTLIKWSHLSLSLSHLLPLLHPCQGYPAGGESGKGSSGRGRERKKRWQAT